MFCSRLGLIKFLTHKESATAKPVWRTKAPPNSRLGCHTLFGTAGLYF